jgi:predicted  nucleic acid-binding Zn-ribbon protein
MDEQIGILLELRGLDDRLQALATRLDMVGSDLQRRQLETSAIRESLEQERGRLAQAESRRREGDREVDACVETQKRFEQQLQGVKTNVEFQALQREIAAVKQKAREWEESILGAMEAEEAAQKTIARVAADLEGKEATEAQEQSRFDAERAEIEQEQERLRQQHDALIERLAPLAKSKYTRLTQSKGTAIVPVIRGSCGGCHYNLPPQTVNEVRRHERLILCEGCGRILVWTEA